MDGTEIKEAIGLQPKYAGFWIRFVAMFIDGLILGVVGFAIGMVLATVAPGLIPPEAPAVAGATPEREPNIIDGISMLVGIAYHVGFTSSKYMGTIGKIAVGIAVTDENGGQISVPRAIGRYFSYIISTIPLMIGFIMAAFHPKKRALHDLICGTYVIYKRR